MYYFYDCPAVIKLNHSPRVFVKKRGTTQKARRANLGVGPSENIKCEFKDS